MKKQYSILWLMAMVVAATFTFTACSDDDKAPERLETTAYDDLDYFQRAIVDVDSLGNFQCRQYGVPLYDNDTTHLYIGVESIEAAEKISATGWLPTSKPLLLPITASPPTSPTRTARRREPSSSVLARQARWPR